MYIEPWGRFWRSSVVLRPREYHHKWAHYSAVPTHVMQTAVQVPSRSM